MTPAESNAPFFVDTEVIRLTKNGVWLSDETEIDHEQTVKMFSKSIQRDEQGYYLRIGKETKRILVEDTPYFVTRIEGTASDGYELWLSNDTRERLNPSTLSYRPGRLACRVQAAKSAGSQPSSHEEAKFLHAAYFDLLKDLQEDAKSYWLQIAGKKIVLAAK